MQVLRAVPSPRSRDAKRGADYALVTESSDNAETLHAIGVLDIFMASELEFAIADVAAAQKPVVLELSDCRYLDSTIISVLIRSHRTLGSGLQIVVKAGSNVDRLLRIARLHDVLPIVTRTA